MSYIYEKYHYSLFESRFRDYGRHNQFRLGLKNLFYHLESLAADTGEPIELDVIALCCEFAEIDIKDIERETGCKDIEELRQATTVVDVDDDTIIYGAF